VRRIRTVKYTFLPGAYGLLKKLRFLVFSRSHDSFF
jgi:hypothetical protein